MSSAPATKPTATPSASQKAALINLLTDDDASVYQAVRDKILSCGQSAIEWLRPHTLSADAPLRRRAHEIIQHLLRQTADDRFLGFCLTEGSDLNLEQGAWLLAQTQYPEINLDAYRALFDSYAGELLERVDLRAEADQLIAAFNEYIFDVLRFRGNETNLFDPESCYLNRVVDRRTGNPVNMCLVYLLLARRLRLPVTGIGLPGYFICRFQSPTEEYYINVFNGGKIWTKADCVQYLVQRHYAVHDEYLAPVNSRRMLARICMGLHQNYRHLQMSGEATRLQRYVVALSK